MLGLVGETPRLSRSCRVRDAPQKQIEIERCKIEARPFRSQLFPLPRWRAVCVSTMNWQCGLTRASGERRFVEHKEITSQMQKRTSLENAGIGIWGPLCVAPDVASNAPSPNTNSNPEVDLCPTGSGICAWPLSSPQNEQCSKRPPLDHRVSALTESGKGGSPMESPGHGA